MTDFADSVAKVRAASVQLARELSGRGELDRAQARIFALESLLKVDKRYRRAALKLAILCGEELAMEHHGKNGTLHTFLETDPDAWSDCVNRIQEGEMPRRLCNACRDPECGATVACRAAREDGRDAATIFETYVPEFFHAEWHRLIEARRAAQEVR